MQIKRIKIANFRGYQKETIIDFQNLTAIIGHNDIGKSTILEALDIFFNDGKGTIKLDKDDINKSSKDSGNCDIKISICFNHLPETIILDDTQETNLKNEYLLNGNDELEICKIFKNATTTASGIKIYIVALHPTNNECANLLSKKQNDLTALIDKNAIPCENKRINHIMRTSIWTKYANEGSLNLELIPIEVNSKDGDIKSIWTKLQMYLPHYALFQSDRKNTDSDNEIQDPLREAVKIILKENELQQRLDYVADKVREQLQAVSNLTLDKLREMNPEIASSLHPRVPSTTELKWADVFKGLSISGDNDIPINKRGSGVKRLILLNFFRAEAERKREGNETNDIIYAIEEPETSQHNRHQNLLIDSLINLSCREGVQVILTTHSPTIVKRLKFSNLILVRDNNGNKEAHNILENTLPYPSINEVNFLAFQELSVEYHNEMYGYLQSLATDEDSKNEKEQGFDNWLEQRGCSKLKTWIRDNGRTYAETLPTYVRNCIHHPENTNNAVYTEAELNTSIEQLRSIISGIKSNNL